MSANHGNTWYSGADLNVQLPGNVEGVSRPRVHRDASEQSAKHRKHMEEILRKSGTELPHGPGHAVSGNA